MKVNMAHLRERSVNGGWVNFAVFDARSNSGSQTDNARLLSQLTHAARSQGLCIDQSSLCFSRNGHIEFYGDRNLVDYLSKNGVYNWTHQISI